MLNEESRLGIQEILSDIDDNSIFSLAATVTQGLLKNKIDSRQEAVNAVLNYSPDAISILKRKVITREIILGYLHKNNVPVDLPATKNDLIQKVIDFWNVQCKQKLIPSNAADGDTIRLLAEQFTHWFYSQMNKNECINHEHFYADAKLRMYMANNGHILTEVVENNPQEIVQKLFLLKMKYNLFFNPNLTREGIRGWVDPHGLVMVMVCGTLHANDACVGIFEQIFALVRDPLAENNWKIKNSE
ncbi:C3orf38 -like protein, partial [Asbolus verrucosus]